MGEKASKNLQETEKGETSRKVEHLPTGSPIVPPPGTGGGSKWRNLQKKESLPKSWSTDALRDTSVPNIRSLGFASEN